MSSFPWHQQPRRFSGELYGAAEDRSRKSLSLGSARAAAESSARDDANVFLQLLLNAQGLLASAWGMHSGLQPIFVSQVPRIQRELSKLGIAVPDEKVLEVLRGRCASSDPDKALQVLIAIEDSKDGVVYDISTDVRMLGGAENNGGVTCFIDSLLFAMFGNMKAFEVVFTVLLFPLPRKSFVLAELWVFAFCEFHLFFCRP